VGAQPTSRDQAPLIAAALDLGSNTLKLTVAEIRADRTLVPIHEEAVITRIGQGLDKNGYLLDEAIERTLRELVRMSKAARDHGANAVRCVGTAGLRGASNARDFLDRVRREANLEVEIIDGLREAELAFRAPAEAFGPGPVLVIDLGGRSTELISGVAGKIEAKVSLEVGSVRLTERFLPSDPPKDEELDRARRHFRGLLSSAPSILEGGRMVGVSGTIVALLGLELGIHDADRLAKEGEGRALHRAAVLEHYERFRRMPARERITGTIIPEGRADVIVAGMSIALDLFDHYGRDEMGVTGHGVRYGLLYELRG
jgi:exopolyphosphatase / guanosine-5'-triphosphate,3'-diphosphate pyrophosphatase